MKLALYVLTSDELPRERRALERLILGLPFGEGERERLLRIRNEAALRQSLGGFLALQQLTQSHGIPPSEVLRTETGKPYFADPRLPAFSISHSDGVCVAALCERADAPVGVDLQLAETRGDPLAIAERFFSAEERWLCADDPEPPSAFFKLWTQKEAIAKASGEGLLTVFRSTDAHSSAHLRTLRIQSGEQVFYLSVAAADGIDALSVTDQHRCRIISADAESINL